MLHVEKVWGWCKSLSWYSGAAVKKQIKLDRLPGRNLMLACVDCDKTPAVKVNGRHAARMTVPASPMVDGRRQSQYLGLVMTFAVVKEVFHAPNGDSAIFNIYKNKFQI